MQSLTPITWTSVCLSAFLIATPCAVAEPLSLKSPNGSVVLQLNTDSAGHLVYSITQSGRERMVNSSAGVTVEKVDLGAEVEIAQPEVKEIQESFPRWGAKKQGTNHCQAYQVPIRLKTGGQSWVFEARVFDDGVGFRYRVPGSGSRRIQGEATSWQLPSDTVVWYQTDTANYEGAYQSTSPEKVPVEIDGKNGKRPVFIGFPMTIAFGDGTYGLVSEAALYQYSGVTAKPTGTREFKAVFQDDPQGWEHTGPITSPWRVMVLAANLNALVNSDVILALCEPPDPKLFPQGFETPWIKPGKAPNTWCVFGNDGAQWHRQKWFVDRAAAMGCEYVLVDAGWRTEKWGWMKDGGDVWARCAELCRYAAERNVGIILWHAYPETRDDGPGLTTVAAREELFSKAKAAGVRGIKIDFFDSESKATVEAYEDLLRRSAKHQLMINFHGANKPTGEIRTWPHEITREGIREQEYLLWDKLPLQHYGALPFTRMVAGFGDFLPGYVRPKYLRNTTAVFQMATAVIFTSPFLNWPDHPDAYVDSSLLQFVRTVPTLWDETRVLEGTVIGDAVVFARRSGEDWYVGVLNCRGESRTLGLDLSFLPAGEYQSTFFRDAPGQNGSYVIEAGGTVRQGQRMEVSLKQGGGFVAHFTKPKSYPGWQ